MSHSSFKTTIQYRTEALIKKHDIVYLLKTLLFGQMYIIHSPNNGAQVQIMLKNTYNYFELH